MNKLWLWFWCRPTRHRFQRVWREQQMSHPTQPEVFMRFCPRCNCLLESDLRHLIDAIPGFREELEKDVGPVERRQG